MSEAPGLVGAETFAAVDPRNNKKLELDLQKLAARTEQHRYLFFMSRVSLASRGSRNGNATAFRFGRSMCSSSTSTEVMVLDPLQGLAEIGAKAPALFLKEARAAERFFDFFTANIQNKHTRRAYFNAVCRFSEFCAERGAHDLARVKPVHVAGYVESLREGFAKPTIKQHLAAIRMLFDWLVVGQIIEVNPAHAVRGPRHVVTKGRTPVLNREEARALLSCIGTSTLTGLRVRSSAL
jgi:hypothetical protein